ncbi:MAG: glycosyltransferase family 4 protein [Gaiellaceae bacterium]
MLTLRAVGRQAAAAPRYLHWLGRKVAAVHYCVALTPTGLTRDLLYIGLARAVRKPVVGHIHNVSDLDRLDRSRLLRLALRLVARWSTAVVVIARVAQVRLQEIGVESRCIYLAQRFDAPSVRKHEAREGDLTVLFVGAYGRAKGLDELIASIAAVRRNGHSVRLKVVGYEHRPGERVRLEALAAEAGAGDAVDFHDPVRPAALRRHYETADVISLPSRREGFPMALLEGMAFGLPPVATAVGGIPELIEDGVSGILVEPGDVAGLTAALERLTDARERARVGAAASHRAGLHSTARATAAWRSLYADVLGSAGPDSYTP